MSKTKKKRRNTKRNNQPVKRRQVTKTQSKPAENTKSPIPQSLINTIYLDASTTTLQDLTEIFNLLNELIFGNDQCLQKNADRLFRLHNVPGPEWYHGLAIYGMISKLKKRLMDERSIKEVEDGLSEIAAKKYTAETDEFFATMIDEIFRTDNTTIYNQLSDQEMIAAMRIIPLDSVDGVTFYHGTSYNNYLQIKTDGVIKRTNYASYRNKDSANKEKYLQSHTGYVFLADSIDKSLSYSLGKTGELDENCIGVIFEFQPKGYNISYMPSESDFVADSDILLSDIDNVRFFYVDDSFQIKEITEQEIEKRGVE